MPENSQNHSAIGRPYNLIPGWLAGLQRCISLEHFCFDFGGILFANYDKDRTMEKIWIQSWSLPELKEVYLNHTYNEDAFGGERPAAAAGHFLYEACWLGETSYWDKTEEGWVRSNRFRTAMLREQRVNLLYLVDPN